MTYQFLYEPYNSGLFCNEGHCNKYSFGKQREQKHTDHAKSSSKIVFA